MHVDIQGYGTSAEHLLYHVAKRKFIKVIQSSFLRDQLPSFMTESLLLNDFKHTYTVTHFYTVEYIETHDFCVRTFGVYKTFFVIVYT